MFVWRAVQRASVGASAAAVVAGPLILGVAGYARRRIVDLDVAASERAAQSRCLGCFPPSQPGWGLGLVLVASLVLTLSAVAILLVDRERRTR